MTTKTEFDMIIEIANRAMRTNIFASDKMTLMMDLEFAHREFNLRLEELLKADDFNFAHDIVGIQNNINRQTKEMDNLFVPRYAGH